MFSHVPLDRVVYYPGGTVYSLIWPPIRGRAAGQGMVFGLSVLNMLYNFIRVCPKQGLNLSQSGYGQYDCRR